MNLKKRLSRWTLRLLRSGAGSSWDPSLDFAAVLTPRNRTIGKILHTLLGKRGGNQLFYFIPSFAPADPGDYGYAFEEVFFQTRDHVTLHAWRVPARLQSGTTRSKGTVVFSHGNTGALGTHFGFAHWLVQAGYDLFMYDYRGYGQSGGEISREGTLLDFEAAVDHVRSEPGADSRFVVSFGHSLGSAVSLTALGRKQVRGVDAAISFGGFTSYLDMARQVLGKAAGGLVTDELSPCDYVQDISPVPLLIVHGESDTLVPCEQGKQLHASAREPKTLMLVPDGGHLDALAIREGEYQRNILAWLEEVAESKRAVT